MSFSNSLDSIPDNNRRAPPGLAPAENGLVGEGLKDKLHGDSTLDKTISKNQQKRQKKQAARKELMIQKRAEGKLKKKLKKKALQDTRAAAQANGDVSNMETLSKINGPSPVQRWELTGQIKKLRLSETDIPAIPQRMNQILLPINLIIDCEFDQLMMEKEIQSLSNQITRCYSENRASPIRCHLRVTGLEKSTKLGIRMNQALKGHHQSWRYFYAHAETIKDCFSNGGDINLASLPEETLSNLPTKLKSAPPMEKSKTIYLTADSENELGSLSDDYSYIIGGLVDRNRHKLICKQKADDLGIETARFPISQYLEMSTRHVLTTNHVVEIMLKWLLYRDWKRAFLDVMPKRKFSEGPSKKKLRRTPRPADHSSSGNYGSGGDQREAGSEESVREVKDADVLILNPELIKR